LETQRAGFFYSEQNGAQKMTTICCLLDLIYADDEATGALGSGLEGWRER